MGRRGARRPARLRTMHLRQPSGMTFARPCITANLGRIFLRGPASPPTSAGSLFFTANLGRIFSKTEDLETSARPSSSRGWICFIVVVPSGDERGRLASELSLSESRKLSSCLLRRRGESSLARRRPKASIPMCVGPRAASAVGVCFRGTSGPRRSLPSGDE